MVSTMESNELRDQLREIERAEASPYVDYRPSPWWWLPGFAFWAAAMVAVQDLHWSAGDDRGAASTILVLTATLGLAAVIGAYLAWYTRYNGTMPALFGRKPPEIRRAYAVYFVAYALALLAILGTVLVAPWWVGGLVTFVLAFALMGSYEWYYAKAAAAVKERLG